MRLDLSDFGRRKPVIVTPNIPNVKFADLGSDVTAKDGLENCLAVVEQTAHFTTLMQCCYPFIDGKVAGFDEKSRRGFPASAMSERSVIRLG
jgi:hypothetical protein